MKTTFSNYLTEGVIKVPPRMFDDANKKVVGELLSFLKTTVQAENLNPEVKATAVKTVDELAAKYGVSLKYIKGKTRSVFKIKADFTGLPVKYKARVGTLGDMILHLDWKHAGRLKTGNSAGQYHELESTGKIVLGISAFSEFAWGNFLSRLSLDKVKSSLVSEVENRFTRILGTLEHEITHYVQYKVLRNLHQSQVQSSDDNFEKGVSNTVAYYSSKIEFDPQIKSALVRYIVGERENYEVGLVEGGRSLWIQVFTGAKNVKTGGIADFIASGKNGGMIRPDRFFLALKSKDSLLWRKAVKIFTQELSKRYPSEGK